MQIRSIQRDDIPRLKEIHQKFYKDEFDFEEFNDKYLMIVVILDENDNIIECLGARTIVELVAITNKDFSVRKRREALLKGLQAISHLIKGFGYSQLHAFIQDKEWLKHLGKYKFRNCKGNALYLDLE